MSNGQPEADSRARAPAQVDGGRIGGQVGAQFTELLLWTGLRVAVLANAVGRGECGGPDLASIVRERVTSLGGLVLEAPCESDVGVQLKAIRRERPAPDVIVAVGGDGTINAGAALAVEAGAALVIVPAGTMNLMARDLDMPLDPTALITALDRLTIRPIDTAAASEHAFLHSSLLGLVPAMAVLREEFRKQRGFRARWRTAIAMVRTAFGAPTLRLRLETAEGARVMSTRSLAVTCNLLAGNALGSHKRAHLDAGVLGVYVSTHRGRLAPLRIIVTLAMGRLPKDPETLSLQCRSLRVDSRRRFVRLSNDGEVVWARTPVLFRVLPGSLRVAVPEPPSAPPPGTEEVAARQSSNDSAPVPGASTAPMLGDTL